MLVSAGGLGKSTAVDEALNGTDYLVIDSHATPVSFYKQLYDNKNKLIVLRDIQNLLNNQITISMLKNLTDTKELKEISYHTTSKLLKDYESSFVTTSKTLVELNYLNANSPHLTALMTRGYALDFQPNATEVINKMKEIAPKITIDLNEVERKEVLDYIISFGEGSDSLNLRTLVRGFQLKEWGKHDTAFDWQDNLRQLMNIDNRLIVLKELQIRPNLSEEEKVKEFMRTTGFSRATYFTLKSKLA